MHGFYGNNFLPEFHARVKYASTRGRRRGHRPFRPADCDAARQGVNTIQAKKGEGDETHEKWPIKRKSGETHIYELAPADVRVPVLRSQAISYNPYEYDYSYM